VAEEASSLPGSLARAPFTDAIANIGVNLGGTPASQFQDL
jgi:hypothetical protein